MLRYCYLTPGGIISFNHPCVCLIELPNLSCITVVCKQGSVLIVWCYLIVTNIKWCHWFDKRVLPELHACGIGLLSYLTYVHFWKFLAGYIVDFVNKTSHDKGGACPNEKRKQCNQIEFCGILEVLCQVTRCLHDYQLIIEYWGNILNVDLSV